MRRDYLKIIVSGGGTGGHIYPAITLIQEIRKLDPSAEFLYVGSTRGLEADIVPKENLPFEAIELSGFERHISFKSILENFSRATQAIRGINRARSILRDFKPDVVVGTGGYVCGPILLAASLMKIPTLIQEQNAVAGVTNKILSKFVTKICVGSDAALKNFPPEKTVYTGNPIRANVMEANREEGIKLFGFNPERPIVLISGGSRGARSINRAMIGVLEHFKEIPSVQFLHVTGKTEFDEVKESLEEAEVDLKIATHIRVEPYLYDMPQAMAMADLAVFRAGATGLAELTARGVPSILIPYPFAAANHQEFNARVLVNAGAARMILNKDLTAGILIETIRELLKNPQELEKMSIVAKSLGRPDAAKDIAQMILDLAK